jgi:hypothetical protein
MFIKKINSHRRIIHTYYKMIYYTYSSKQKAFMTQFFVCNRRKINVTMVCRLDKCNILCWASVHKIFQNTVVQIFI